MTTVPSMQTVDRLSAIIALLACPDCGNRLRERESSASLECVECHRQYPVRAGVPILLPESMSEPGVGAVSIDDPVSRHPYSPAALKIIESHKDGWILDLGAGGKLQRWDNVIQIDIFRYPMTDVVATADRLPFRDNTFKAVISQAVFEHLQYPEWAAAEIRRVLQPGGVAKIDTAFLQPEHGYPHHYYNATETGLRHWFRDFDIRWSGVEAYQHPKWSLAWFLGVYLDRLDEAQAAILRSSTLEQMLGALERSSAGFSEPVDVPILGALDALPAHSERELAAGVSVDLVNPVKTDAGSSFAVRCNTISGQTDDVRKLLAAREDIAMLRYEHSVIQEQHVLAMDGARYLNRFYPGREDASHLVLPAWGNFRAVAFMRDKLPRQAWFKLRHIAMRRQQRSRVRPGVLNSTPLPFVSVIMEPREAVDFVSTFFSLVRQTYTGWELIVLEAKNPPQPLWQTIDDIASMDERVHIVSGFSGFNERLSQAKSIARGEYCLCLPDGATLAFDAINQFVTLARDRPGTPYISADFEHGNPEMGFSMRCYSFVPAVKGALIKYEFPWFFLVRNQSQGNVPVKRSKHALGEDTVALIPEVLFRHVGDAVLLGGWYDECGS